MCSTFFDPDLSHMYSSPMSQHSLDLYSLEQSNSLRRCDLCVSLRSIADQSPQNYTAFDTALPRSNTLTFRSSPVFADQCGILSYVVNATLEKKSDRDN
jgi:hypothetical protein